MIDNGIEDWKNSVTVENEIKMLSPEARKELITGVVKGGLEDIADDYNMNGKEVTEGLGCSYSHALSVKNGSKILNLNFFDNLAMQLRSDIEQLTIRYFQFMYEPTGLNTPAIAIFNNERVTELDDQYKLLYEEEIKKLGVVEAKRIWTSSPDKVEERAKEVIRSVYREFLNEKKNRKHERQQTYEWIQANRKQMADIIQSLSKESNEFLEEIQEFIEYKKYKNKEKKDETKR